MSITQHSASVARQQGLRVAAFGQAAAALDDYRSLRHNRTARLDAQAGLLAGRPLHGVRLDAASRTARNDAALNAHAAQWADYFAGRFGGRPQEFMEYGRHVAMSYAVQLHGKPGEAYRLDATVPMASQGLIHFIPEVYKIQHVDLPFWDERVLKIWRGVDPAAESYVWYETDNVGVAKAGSTYDVTTIPMVAGPVANSNDGRIIPALVGMETNFMDPRRENFAASQGKPDFQIEVMKRQAAERAIAEFFDNLWFGGDVSHGIDGLMNNPIVSTLPISGGTWASKTPLQILDDLKTMVYAIPNRTFGGLPDLGKITIWLPPNQEQLLIQPITSAGSASIKDYFNQHFKGESRGVPKIAVEYRLAATNSCAYNGGPNILAEDTALITYQDGDQNRDPVFVLSQPIEVPAPVRNTGVGDVTYFHARGGGLKLPDARRLIYVVGL